VTEVEIEYCVPCGYLDRAVSVQRALLTAFGERLDAVTLRTGDHGVFRVTVDGEPVFDIADDEFDVDETVRRARQYV
jgi:selenoprotein W-related protein